MRSMVRRIVCSALVFFGVFALAALSFFVLAFAACPSVELEVAIEGAIGCGVGNGLACSVILHHIFE